jgi:hypothetical protein
VEERLHTVPKGVEGYEKVYLRCTGWINMPERVTPLCRAGEQAIITTLVRELKDNFGVRVSEKLILDRDTEVERVENEYVVWGGSNAGRLADVMSAAPLQPIPIPGRRFSHIHLDLVGPLPASKEGHTHILTIIDRTTTLVPTVIDLVQHVRWG